MGFQHPEQKDHMMKGCAAACASDKTPPHLKPHLQKRMNQKMAKPDKNAPVGQGGRFAAMVASGKSPALAAFIGRKKYGAKKMSQMAAKGRKSAPSTDAFRGR